MSQRSSRQQRDAPPPAESVFAPDCILRRRALRDYPNFQCYNAARSDVSQLGGRVAHPVASPQPVVGVHFEAISGRGTDRNPLFAPSPPSSPSFFQIPSVRRISIQAANARRGYSVTRSGQVWRSCVGFFFSGAEIHCFCKKKSKKIYINC